METLMKIRDVSLTYGVSVRTLRYYEDMGLIESVRESDTAYRSYQSSQIHKLEQILFLRKINLSIKEIKEIYASNHADALLKILDQKSASIDNDISNLHNLKTLIRTFIKQLKTLNLSSDSDLKLLMDQVHLFEQQMNADEKTGNNESLQTKKTEGNFMSRIADVRLVTLPACKMVSSGLGNFDQENFTKFDTWFSKFPILNCQMPKDFLWFDQVNGGLVWWYQYSEGMDTEDFEVVEFEGGLYVAAVSKDGDDEDGNRVYDSIKNWIAENETFQLDERPNHYTMSHIITTPEEREILGYSQLEILVPVKNNK